MNLMHLIWAIFKSLIIKSDFLYSFCILLYPDCYADDDVFYISNFSLEVYLPSNGMKINDGSTQVSEL